MNDPIFFSYFYDPQEILEHFSIAEVDEEEEESEIECSGPLLQMNSTLFPLPLNTILADTVIVSEEHFE